MSALRIRYETMQLRKRYETHELLPEEAEHLLGLTQNAFDAWSQAYPRDTWLASTGFAMAELYAELPGKAAQEQAVVLYVYVKSHFPSTTYGAKSRTVLHHGVPVRPDPAWAQARRAVTPSPSPPPSTLPSISPSPLPTGSGSPPP